MSQNSEKSFPEKRLYLGKQGEQQVAAFLQKDGFIIQEKNYRTPFGEIDLIAQKKNLIAFVEVKTRSHHYFGLSQVVTPSKQRKIIKTAQSYIIKNNFSQTIFRFDIALIEGGSGITYIPNAFTIQEIF